MPELEQNLSFPETPTLFTHIYDPKASIAFRPNKTSSLFLVFALEGMGLGIDVDECGTSHSSHTLTHTLTIVRDIGIKQCCKSKARVKHALHSHSDQSTFSSGLIFCTR